MKRSPLHETHLSLGAKMIPFAGYEMPLSYTSISTEHITVRSKVGMFDVSHMGEFILKGPDAIKLIQKVSSNDASALSPGKAQYSCMPNENGGIVDDLLIYQIEEFVYMLVVNASNIKKDWNWISQHNRWSVELHDISDKTTLLAVQGPSALATLQPLTEMNLRDMKYYTFKKGKFANQENILISATGYTGAGGFEIYLENMHAIDIWEAIMKSGNSLGLRPVGLAARDTLRLEMGFCLYGNDITDNTSPLEARLGWITKLEKEFIGSKIIAKKKSVGITRQLAGFEMVEKGIPRKGYKFFNNEGDKIGEVTSGSYSPSLNKAIGLGYIDKPYNETGTSICVEIRDKRVKAKVVKTPFYS